MGESKFCNILETHLLYSSYNETSLAFKLEAIVSHHLKLLFCQFFDPTLIPLFILQGEELLHWSFHLLLVIEVLWAQEVSHGLEQVIIWRNLVQIICWLWHQFNSFEFLEFIPETSMFANIAKLLTCPSTYEKCWKVLSPNLLFTFSLTFLDFIDIFFFKVSEIREIMCQVFWSLVWICTVTWLWVIP